MLCGGAGARFWPLSREGRPKQFLELFGDGSLLEHTLDRLSAFATPRNTWVVVGPHIEAITRRALRGRAVRVLVEPAARDTAPAIALASARIAAEHPDALVGVFPADHHIPARRAFERALVTARRAALKRDSLALIGIEPREPSTGFGYLSLGDAIAPGARSVRRFVEKPGRSRARRLIENGALWNAGIVVGTAKRILAETQYCAPEIWKTLGSALDKTRSRRRVTAVTLKRAYLRLTPRAFDHAVLERSRRVCAVRGRFRWADLGSWDALAAQIATEVPGRTAGTSKSAGGKSVIRLDASDNFVWNATDKTVALLGVEGLVVVNTDDALLVCSQESAQEVRRVVDELRRRGRKELI